MNKEIKREVQITDSAIKANGLRLDQITEFLAGQGYKNFSLAPASEDASFRRYYRMTIDGYKSLIVMDAPPDKESLSPFIEIALDWGSSGISVPKMHQYSREIGILILQDFGSETFLNGLTPSNVKGNYQLAIDELLKIQEHRSGHLLPQYNSELLMREMQLFIDWFLIKHCCYEPSKQELKDLQDTFRYLKESALAQKQVIVHRDFHSRNLMLRGQQSHGLIDFQDAVIGPVSYDLVSLLKDCYKKLDAEFRDELIDYYLDKAKVQAILSTVELGSFRKGFDLMGVQRHLKAIGIFARLYHRDSKSNYLHDIPLTASYILDLEQEYPELKVLLRVIKKVMPNFNQNMDI